MNCSAADSARYCRAVSARAASRGLVGNDDDSGSGIQSAQETIEYTNASGQAAQLFLTVDSVNNGGDFVLIVDIG